MQLTSLPFHSTFHIRRRSPQIVGETRRLQAGLRAQLSAPLDEALSAKRVNKQQIRALCELQQEQARSQQLAAEIQLMRTQAMLRDRSVKLLFAKGLLNVRGVIE